MAASQGLVATTASSCTPEMARGRHIFEVTGYSMLKVLGVAEYIESAPFTVGGYDWCISYCPNGDEEYEDYASIFLYLMSETTNKVRVLYDFRLLNPATGVFSSVRAGTDVLDTQGPSSHTADFMERSELEASYLRDDRLVIECDISVMLGTPVSKRKSLLEIQVPPSDVVVNLGKLLESTEGADVPSKAVSKSRSWFEIQVPPSNVVDNLGKLLESTEGADVTFKVQDEVFHAHKIVLAMRSPVFKAELLGPMSDKSGKVINLDIDDMQPAIFQMLLHFICNDSLPAMEDLNGDENEEMIKDLLVAADRFGLERLKVICESILSKKLDAESVATTLALADQNHCSQLKDACIKFIESSNRVEEVADNQGYAHLKRECPSVTVEIWEKVAKSRRM